MSQVLIDETKKALGYTEVQVKCGDCKYASEYEDQGGLWNWSCDYNNVCSFCVKAYAHCDKFERRINP
ncbi:hypothetical protein [Parabacteroides hominis]|uniref:Demethylase n=1 Tax=Parabacteroides hominis TaxID=2763057 RepID=A0ABR7DMD2_9BACT|nr:hypothetical protein [Parabacteroides hominis]MBC5632097.1 hypothetical protein [Parabacteroides hominis]